MGNRSGKQKKKISKKGDKQQENGPITDEETKPEEGLTNGNAEEPKEEANEGVTTEGKENATTTEEGKEPEKMLNNGNAKTGESGTDNANNAEASSTEPTEAASQETSKSDTEVKETEPAAESEKLAEVVEEVKAEATPAVESAPKEVAEESERSKTIDDLPPPPPTPPESEPPVEEEEAKPELPDTPAPELPTSAPPTEEEIAETGAEDESVAEETCPAPPAEDEASEVKVAAEFKWEHGGETVKISGSFNDWKEEPLQKQDSVFLTTLKLAAGEYLYKYLVDDAWSINENQPTKCDESGANHNVILVEQAA